MTAKDMPLPEGLNFVLVEGPEGPVAKTAVAKYFDTKAVLAHREEYAAARCAHFQQILQSARPYIQDFIYSHPNDCYDAREILEAIDAARTEAKP